MIAVIAVAYLAGLLTAALVRAFRGRREPEPICDARGHISDGYGIDLVPCEWERTDRLRCIFHGGVYPHPSARFSSGGTVSPPRCEKKPEPLANGPSR